MFRFALFRGWFGSVWVGLGGPLLGRWVGARSVVGCSVGSGLASGWVIGWFARGGQCLGNVWDVPGKGTHRAHIGERCMPDVGWKGVGWVGRLVGWVLLAGVGKGGCWLVGVGGNWP